MNRVVVVGGVAGGMSAAGRIMRLDPTARVTVFEQDNDISFGNCGMPYYIGGVIEDRNRLLVQTPASIRQRYDMDVRVRHRVTGIDRTGKSVTVHSIDDDRDLVFEYDKLLLAPGAFPIRPPLPGVDRPDVLILKNLDDMDLIRKAAVAARRAVVVGAGFIGIEVAENLRHLGLNVTVVERLDQVLPAMDREMTIPLLDEARRNGISVLLSAEVKAIDDQGVHLGDGRVLPTDFTVMSVGVRPVSGLAADAGLDLTRSGHIKVNEYLQTSDPDIYAVGDAVAVFNALTGTHAGVPLAGPANRQARIAGDNICGRKSRYNGNQGTAIVKFFNQGAASVGLNARQLQAAGVGFRTAYVHPLQHPAYYPGASMLDVKLMFDDAGLILGAQATGHEGVDVVINSLAQAMRGGQTVFDLEEMELAYCPVWGNAKHPVNTAGFVASNILRGDVEIFEPTETPDVWLDVREAGEVAAGHIPGALHIPLGQLERRQGEIPRDRMVGIYCAVGLRGYIAYRRLKALGFNVRNLNGGYRTWRAVHS